MRILTASVLALSISMIGSAYAAPQTKGSPLRDLTVRFGCNGSQPDYSTWTIQGESEDGNWVTFDSKSDPSLVIFDSVFFLETRALYPNSSYGEIELGHVLGPAACEPADDGSGYGNSFEPKFLNVMLQSDVSLSVVPGTQQCEPGVFNSGTLNTLVIRMQDSTYLVQQTSCL